ncbi:MAG: hypothetical protein HY885_17905 [Deltaproteobacteria bacterium]|nr:hypothetical protein [Deltaproteobacteria bacterium]
MSGRIGRGRITVVARALGPVCISWMVRFLMGLLACFFMPASSSRLIRPLRIRIILTCPLLPHFPRRGGNGQFNDVDGFVGGLYVLIDYFHGNIKFNRGFRHQELPRLFTRGRVFSRGNAISSGQYQSGNQDCIHP